ncbi:MAG: helix-turn-helix transcriptional regulator [Ruminococcaceae bacterium]|nr:helix-turn-helix transcriptional regulator [Oscillospiraceae bacterium]MBR3598005.1 helix-turn-helix transcriptional regulator [Clostridia bacterium]
MELKDRLKELRANANLTQEALANQIFVSRTLVSKWESGERYPSKDNLARLAVMFQISQEELIGGKKEKDKYNKYNILSIAYSSVCGVMTLGLITMMIIAVIERVTLNDGWTGMGGFIICLTYILPIILALVLFETITLKKKNGYKILELYSIFTLILVWLLSIPAYLYMI